MLVRSSFPGRHEGIPLFRFFPGASRVGETFPTVEETVDTFAAAGFGFEALEQVHEAGMTMAELATRVPPMRHSDSTLAPLSDEEFAAGMAAIERAAAADPDARPQPDWLDLLVLR